MAALRGHISETQTQELIAYLTANLLPTTQAVIRLVKEGWDISYIVPGMNKWLRHMDSVIKNRPACHTGSMRNSNGPILFIDGVHPTQGTKLAYGWCAKARKLR